MRYHLLKSLVAIVSVLTAAQLATAAIHWETDIDRARKLAIQTNRLVLLHFWSDDCGPCRVVDRNVFPRSDVQRAFDSGFVGVKVHGKRSPHLTQKYQVKGWPTDIILTPDGREITRSVTPQDPNDYIRLLDTVAAYSRLNLQAPAVASIADHRTPHAVNAPSAPTAPRFSSSGIAVGQTTQQPQTRPTNTRPQTPPQRQYASNPYAAAANSGSQYGQPQPPRYDAAQFPPQHTAPQHTVPQHTVPQHTVPQHTVPQHTVPQHTVPQHTVPQHTANWSPPTRPAPQIPHADPATRTANAARLHATDATASATTPAPDTPVYRYGNQQANAGNNFYQPGSTLHNPGHTSPSAETAPPLQNQPTSQPQVSRYGPSYSQSAQTPSTPPQPSPQGYGAPTSQAFGTPASQFSASPPPASPSQNVAGNRYQATPNLVQPSFPTSPQPQATSSAPQANSNGGRITDSAFAGTRPAGGNPAMNAPLALDGFCPVTLQRTRTWLPGDPRYVAIHLGRTYYCAGPQELAQFQATPAAYSPMLSGYDPVIFLKYNKLVEGGRAHGLWLEGREMLLFANEATLEEFDRNPGAFLPAIKQAMSARMQAEQRR